MFNNTIDLFYKGTVSSAERCNLVGVKLDKVVNFFAFVA